MKYSYLVPVQYILSCTLGQHKETELQCLSKRDVRKTNDRRTHFWVKIAAFGYTESVGIHESCSCQARQSISSVAACAAPCHATRGACSRSYPLKKSSTHSARLLFNSILSAVQRIYLQTNTSLAICFDHLHQHKQYKERCNQTRIGRLL